jgi:hypothetical protein
MSLIRMRNVSTGLVLAVALTGAACESRTATDSANQAGERPSVASAGHEGAPITVTGCLQRMKRGDTFILTRINTAENVGAVGTTGAPAAERQQERAAWHAYRIAGEEKNLEHMVGRQVRVVGTLNELSDLKKERGQAGQQGGERPDTDIDPDDLAEVKLTSIAMVADVCGTGGAKDRAPSDAR